MINPSRSRRVYLVLLLLYVGIFLMALINLAAPPGNMPLLVLMALSAAGMLLLRLSGRQVLLSGGLLVIAAVLITKEYHDGVELRKRVDAILHHSDSRPRSTAITPPTPRTPAVSNRAPPTATTNSLHSP